MKIFEMPNIEVLTFTAESIMNVSNVEPTPTPSLPGGTNRLPWG